MVDPTGGTIANITVEMLKKVAMAARTSPQAVSTAVQQIAATLGTSTAAVVRGITVSMGSSSAATAGWAGTATTAVQGAVAEGALVTTEVAVAGTAATTTTGGLVAWFGGLSVAAQVALVVALVGGTVLIARGAGWAASDSASAVAGSGPGTTASFGPAPSVFSEGYQAVAVHRDGRLSIVSVRGTTELEDGIAPCNFRHGGIDCDSDADVRPLVEEVFGDADAATRALCGLLGGPRFAPALAAGWKVPYGDGSVTLDDWGQVDFEACDEVLEGK